MDYTLAKELKDAGFPFTEHDDDRICKIMGGLGYAATLSELIDACGDDLDSIENYGNGTWVCYGTPTEHIDSADLPEQFQGKNPEEAVAKLYLALNKK